MADQQPKKPGLRAKRLAKKRLKQERAADTPQKQREDRAGGSYDAEDARTRASLGGLIGGAGGSGGA